MCIFWGTTYLGIRVALESFPPSLLMCLRYTISGGALLIGALAAGARLPTAREFWRTSLYGAITIGMGTGSLVLSEQWIPSGLASLFVCTQPFWMVGVEACRPGGERLHSPSIAGMLVGLAGVLLLLTPGGSVSQGVGTAALLRGFLVLQFGAMMWSWGSVAQRRLGGRAHSVVSGGIQQLATGLAFAIPAALEPGHADWNARGVTAILYLAVFGGIVGYSSFIYALHHLPVAVVSIYTYINPLVAVALGWWFYREPFGWRETAAMAIILAGVTMVKLGSGRGRPRQEEDSVPME